jgi:hypothetical protein
MTRRDDLQRRLRNLRAVDPEGKMDEAAIVAELNNIESELSDLSLQTERMTAELAHRPDVLDVQQEKDSG